MRGDGVMTRQECLLRFSRRMRLRLKLRLHLVVKKVCMFGSRLSWFRLPFFPCFSSFFFKIFSYLVCDDAIFGAWCVVVSGWLVVNCVLCTE
ncbi:hypothetical protein IWZ03DRAFT_45274 [Phyllosticta citriasiana]|uniref:Transmembrane protein n=1 Tax=Phyllosticta citriasiana TaxID=595635 RepID=A0ABR1KEW1_9PEZI